MRPFLAIEFLAPGPAPHPEFPARDQGEFEVDSAAQTNGRVSEGRAILGWLGGRLGLGGVGGFAGRPARRPVFKPDGLLPEPGTRTESVPNPQRQSI